MTAVPLHASRFTDDFVDVPALNEHVSAALLERIENVRDAASRGELLPTLAYAVLGPAGGGKTHLFVRLRQRSAPGASLVLLRPYFGVSLTLRDVLSALVDQLCLPAGDHAQTQLEVIAAHWRRGEDGQMRAVDDAMHAIVARVPEAAAVVHLARALLVLNERSAHERWTELAWLSGREPRVQGRTDAPPAESPAPAPGALGEGDVLHLLRLLAVLAAPVAPLVITFDQLENLAGDELQRVLGYGNLVSELVDSVPCATIVQLALTSEWMQFIEPRLSLPQRTRVAHATLVLEVPDRDKREQLLRAWHRRLAERTTGGRKRRFPAPLAPADLETLVTAPGMTPRLLLSAFSRAVAGQPMMEAAPSEARPAIEHALWTTEYARALADLEERERSRLPCDPGELAEALASALSFVPRLEVATHTERERVYTRVKAPGHELTVVYLTSLHHASVGATLGKAAELAAATKVVIVRERRFELPATWESVVERRLTFEQLPNARWLWLERDDVARCLALARLSSQARAKRVQLAGREAPLSLEHVHEEVLRATAPDQWEPVASIVRWLSDVPRAAGAPSVAPVRAPVRPARDRENETTKTVSAEPAVSDEAAPPLPSLRGWLSLGRAVGKATVLAYVDKVRRRAGR